MTCLAWPLPRHEGLVLTTPRSTGEQIPDANADWAGALSAPRPPISSRSPAPRLRQYTQLFVKQQKTPEENPIVTRASLALGLSC